MVVNDIKILNQGIQANKDEWLMGIPAELEIQLNIGIAVKHKRIK